MITNVGDLIAETGRAKLRARRVKGFSDGLVARTSLATSHEITRAARAYLSLFPFESATTPLAGAAFAVLLGVPYIVDANVPRFEVWIGYQPDRDWQYRIEVDL